MSLNEVRIVSASRKISLGAAEIFAVIADPSRQPEWDGNDNLAVAASGQEVRGVGDVFATTLTMGSVRENHVVEFVEDQLIAWKPAEQGKPPVGHLWRWSVEQVDAESSIVTHTYDWTDLHDESRFPRARYTTSDRLLASIDRLAELLEGAKGR